MPRANPDEEWKRSQGVKTPREAMDSPSRRAQHLADQFQPTPSTTPRTRTLSASAAEPVSPSPPKGLRNIRSTASLSVEVPHAQALKNEGVTTLVGAVKAGQSAGERIAVFLSDDDEEEEGAATPTRKTKPSGSLGLERLSLHSSAAGSPSRSSSRSSSARSPLFPSTPLSNKSAATKATTRAASSLRLSTSAESAESLNSLCSSTCVVKSMTVLVHEDKIKTGDCPVVGCKDRKGEEIFFHLYTTHSTVNGADITWLKN